MKRYLYPALSIAVGVLIALPLPVHTATYRPPVTSIPDNSITSAKINNGTIVNADVSGSANITVGKLYDNTGLGVVPYSTSNGTLGVSTVPNAGEVLSFLNNKPTWVATTTWPRATSIIPTNPTPGGTLSTITTNSNTTGYVRRFLIDQNMTPAKFTVDVSAVGVAGVLKFGIYSEDGQTQIASSTTGSISATGTTTVAFTAFALPQGQYNLMTVPVGTADLTLRSIGLVSTNLANGVPSEPVYNGNATVSAGTLPSTFDPNTLTGSASGVLFRLDN